MLVSVVIPVYRDDQALERVRAQLLPDPRVEVIVVEPPPLGRGAQMNAGAARANGDWLLFLHADSRLPARWVDVLEDLIGDPDLVGGWFRFALDAPDWQARVIERLVAFRVRVWRLPYGDQGLFVRRDVFERLGGYQPWPLMEDVEFVRRLRRSGRVAELPLALATSARRWQREGWWWRSTRNVVLVSLYFVGVSPGTLAKWYSKRRDPAKQQVN
jgi:rSAM/selenodomain-associated transferase 2